MNASKRIPIEVRSKMEQAGRAAVAFAVLAGCSSAATQKAPAGTTPDPAPPPIDAGTVEASIDAGPDAQASSAAVAVTAAQGTACARTPAGLVACWNDSAAPTAGFATDPTLQSGVTAIALGGDLEAGGDPFACVLTREGGVACWGNENRYGQLGDGTTTPSSTPAQVTGLASGVTAISAGCGYEAAACAVTSSGAVDCWGTNASGQLGNATSAAYSAVPVAVGGLPSATAVAVGGTFVCALAGGGVWCWGANQEGQLGDGTTTSSATPVQVTGLANGVVAMSAAVEHACAIVDGGAVECWGNGAYSQNGDGLSTNSAVPVQVTGLTSGATAISTDDGAACAITASGGVVCWGLNSGGQLGDGTTTTRATPVPVLGLTSGVTQIAMGYGFACAATANDGVYCWGGGYSAVPVHVAGLPQ